MANQLVLEEGTFSAAAQTSSPLTVYGGFSVSAKGDGTVSLQRTFDSGTTWYTVHEFTTADAVESINLVEPEKNAQYQLVCGSLNTGVIEYRIATTGNMYS
jgi:hypothetical protein